jgi:uncharacterized protein (TIGR03435 family)
MKKYAPRMTVITALAFGAQLALAQPPASVNPPKTPAGRPLAFTVISIKPHGNAQGGTMGCTVDGCRAVNIHLRVLIATAYNLSNKLVLGGPSWADSDHFDLDAKIDPADMPATPLSFRQLADMLQPVLAERFQLRVHHEIRTFPSYNLFPRKGDSRLTATIPANGMLVDRCQIESKDNGFSSVHNCGMDDIAHLLWSVSGRFVVDRTGLTGRYSFELRWTPDNTPAGSSFADSSAPSIFTAVQEQLGLKLSPSTTPLDVLVIDSAEKPTPN